MYRKRSERSIFKTGVQMESSWRAGGVKLFRTLWNLSSSEMVGRPNPQMSDSSLLCRLANWTSLEASQSLTNEITMVWWEFYSNVVVKCFFFQCFISLFSLSEMNSSPARKRNCGLSKLEREEQEVFMFTVCGPHLRTNSWMQKPKKKRTQSPSFSAAGRCGDGKFILGRCWWSLTYSFFFLWGSGPSLQSARVRPLVGWPDCGCISVTGIGLTVRRGAWGCRQHAGFCLEAFKDVLKESITDDRLLVFVVSLGWDGRHG